MKFGEKIRRYRENNNLTQKDLGDQLHLTDDAIYKWEAGKSFPDVPMLRNLVELTGYDAETLTNDNRSIEAYYGLPVSAKTFLYEKTINARAKMLEIDTILRTVCIVEKSIYSGGLANVGRMPAFFML